LEGWHTPGVSTSLVRQFSAAALAVLVVACAAGSNAGYEAAGAGLAGVVIGSGVNRAVTGDCWAICSRGFACDRQRGTCERAECEPECAQGEHCVIEQDGRFRCMEATGMLRIGSNTSKPPVSSAPSVAPPSSAPVQ
jgi:hypothetical protein